MDFLQGQSIVHRTNETVLADVAFKKKSLILYYFTGLDCDACRAFDPKLFEVYNEALFRRIELAVVIISNDENKEDFLTNLRTNYNDWYAIKFGDELNQILTYSYGVTHIPTLIVVRQNGTIVTRDGKRDIDSIGINVLVTWSE